MTAAAYISRYMVPVNDCQSKEGNRKKIMSFCLLQKDTIPF